MPASVDPPGGDAPSDPGSSGPSRGPRRRGWRRAALGALGLLGPIILAANIGPPFDMAWHRLVDPPPEPPSVEQPPTAALTALVNLETAAARATSRDEQDRILARLFAPGAEVVDAGCHGQQSGTAWRGLVQITRRYAGLRPFDSLRHSNLHVTWTPADRDNATGSSETTGVISASGRREALPIANLDRWVFRTLDGHWVVTSFTYNVCLH